MNVQQYTGAIAASYNSQAALSHPMNQVTHLTWINHLKNLKGKFVLDIACGGGHSSRLLAARGAHVTGIDISRDMVIHAREVEASQPLGIEYLAGDAAGLDLGRTFDIVTPSFLFHYASSLDEMRSYMKAAHNHLAPCGRMVALHAWTSIVPRIDNAAHWSEWVDSDTANVEGTKIRLHVLAADGSEVCAFEYYHWKQETYDAILSECGFTNIHRTLHKVPKKLRQHYPNWSQLEKFNASCVLAADKVM
jgi:SAM-dependent methyltransferase